jgi:hypothetical protein
VAGLLSLSVLALGALFGGSASSALAAEACPNEALRIQSNVNSQTGLPFSSGLPECRAYEMVSPVEKQAHDVREYKFLSADGESVAFNIFGQTPDGEGFNAYNSAGNTFLAKRSSVGWATRATTAPGTIIQRAAGVPFITDYSPDFSRYITCGSPSGGAGHSVDTAACALHTPNGWISSPIYRTINGVTSETASVTYMGGSSDLSHVVFAMGLGKALLPADNYTSGEGASLYEIAGLGTDSPVLRLVNVDNSGTQIVAPGKGLALGDGVSGGSGGAGYQAVSDDGNTIYFSTFQTGTTFKAVFARRNGTTTVNVSNPSPSECTTCDPTPSNATYQAASADGSKVFFFTNQQLVNADSDITRDLYMYDFDNSPGHHIVQVSGGGTGDLSPGAGADLQGVARTSPDGSHTYFVASGVLTTLPNGNGQVASAGSPNLYMFQRDAEHPGGLTKFVATLLPADSELWKFDDVGRAARTSRDGRFLVFTSKAALTPDDLDTARDAYRYDSVSGQLLRMSIGEPAYPASNNGNTAGKEATVAELFSTPYTGAHADVNQRNNPISDDGSYVLFTTTEQLQANDVNGVSDAYLWHEGSVSMISDGRDTSAIAGIQAIETAMSADGGDVTFNTRTELTPSDTDELLDIYDAKVGGGILYTPPPPLCPDVDACRGAAAAAPAGAVAGTASFSGPANPAPGKPAKKKKHKKKHHKTQHPKKHSTGKRR